MTAAVANVEVARLHGPGDVRVVGEPAPQPAPGEVVLQVTAVGLCGSDLHWYEEAAIGDARLSRPLVLGHEFAAVIVSGPRAGERVAVDPADPCGACGPCLAGRSNLCLAMRFAGHGTTDGALRSLMAWPERLCHRLPDALLDDEAALLEPVGVALHALDLARVELGGRAGVYGCGPLGLLLVQLLRIAGASHIVATDRLAHRVAAASQLGADEAVLVRRGDRAETLGGQPVDVAFEVAGDDDALEDAMTAVRPGGRVVLVGIPAGDRTSFTAGLARRKGLTLVLSRRMAPIDLRRAIDLAGAGRLALTPLITERFSLARAPEAFAALVARRGLKVVVNPSLGGPAGARVADGEG
ncbi:MAG: zinc-dependent alcohol dehydrogenase [Candidatus Limnocylindrales bacterium]